ncbi:hypothetical protein B0H65DRAFT_591218 [Neurospora tetraspora]|uniref:RRM domain-containing protein n=1 Tax=Neurospora tetraspora TaxID=94610 RepID=A0AAE0MP19_9PEZI|nr:hypothetical protein B0H65DRAFT_591218 [Neurospora tetraspora]
MAEAKAPAREKAQAHERAVFEAIETMVTSTLWAYHSSKSPDRSLDPRCASQQRSGSCGGIGHMSRERRAVPVPIISNPELPPNPNREAITTTCDARGRRHCVNGSKSYNCGESPGALSGWVSMAHLRSRLLRPLILRSHMVPLTIGGISLRPFVGHLDRCSRGCLHPRDVFGRLVIGNLAQHGFPNKRALYVGGLDPRVTEDVLRQIFETTGHVQNVKIIPDFGAGPATRAFPSQAQGSRCPHQIQGHSRKGDLTGKRSYGRLPASLPRQPSGRCRGGTYKSGPAPARCLPSEAPTTGNRAQRDEPPDDFDFDFDFNFALASFDNLASSLARIFSSSRALTLAGCCRSILGEERRPEHTDSDDEKPEVLTTRPEESVVPPVARKADQSKHCKYYSTGGNCVYPRRLDPNPPRSTLLNDKEQEDLSIVQAIKYLQDKGAYKKKNPLDQSSGGRRGVGGGGGRFPSAVCPGTRCSVAGLSGFGAVVPGLHDTDAAKVANAAAIVMMQVKVTYAN